MSASLLREECGNDGWALVAGMSIKQKQLILLQSSIGLRRYYLERTKRALRHCLLMSIGCQGTLVLHQPEINLFQSSTTLHFVNKWCFMPPSWKSAWSFEFLKTWSIFYQYFHKKNEVILPCGSISQLWRRKTTRQSLHCITNDHNDDMKQKRSEDQTCIRKYVDVIYPLQIFYKLSE